MASKNVWFAKDASIWLSAVVGAVSGSTTLESQAVAVSTWTSRIKNLKIEPQERDVEIINVCGFQQLKQLNRPTMVVATFNTVFYPMGTATTSTSLNAFLFGPGAAVGATGYNRYQGGEKSSDRSDLGVLFKFSRPGGAVADTAVFFLNNANVTAGPVSMDAEGHVEQEFTVKCLAGDLYMDFGTTADPNA